MKEVIAKLVELTNLVYSREANWKEKEMRTFPGASEAEIQTLAADSGKPLPPSYRCFLTETNGVLGFWARYTLLGCRSETRQPIEQAVADAKKHQSELIAGPGGSPTEAQIVEFEQPSDTRQRLFLPVHFVFGANQAGEFFLFDDRAAAEEPPVLHYTFSAGIYRTFENFEAFLSARLAMLSDRVKQRKYLKSK